MSSDIIKANKKVISVCTPFFVSICCLGLSALGQLRLLGICEEFFFNIIKSFSDSSFSAFVSLVVYLIYEFLTTSEKKRGMKCMLEERKIFLTIIYTIVYCIFYIICATIINKLTIITFAIITFVYIYLFYSQMLNKRQLGIIVEYFKKVLRK